MPEKMYKPDQNYGGFGRGHSDGEGAPGPQGRPGPPGINPKDQIGSTKVDLALIPASALVACALAMTDGGLKYDPYNWRESGKPVQARTYVSASLRHVFSWFDGREELSPDALVHHLGHAMACFAILIDAQSCGQLVDNRPLKGQTPRLLKEGESTTKELIRKARERLAAIVRGGP